MNLTLDSSWYLGLIGRNSKGKSTLLRLLAQKEIFSGQIRLDVDFEIYLLEVPNFDQTLIEVFRTLCPFQEDWEFLGELNQLDPTLVNAIYVTLLFLFSK